MCLFSSGWWQYSVHSRLTTRALACCTVKWPTRARLGLGKQCALLLKVKAAASPGGSDHVYSRHPDPRRKKVWLCKSDRLDGIPSSFRCIGLEANCKVPRYLVTGIRRPCFTCSSSLWSLHLRTSKLTCLLKSLVLVTRTCTRLIFVLQSPISINNGSSVKPCVLCTPCLGRQPWQSSRNCGLGPVLICNKRDSVNSPWVCFTPWPVPRIPFLMNYNASPVALLWGR